MLKKAKKILTGIIASAMVLSCAGCGTGKSTAYALTVDGYQVKAGVYIIISILRFRKPKILLKKLMKSWMLLMKKLLKRSK